MTLIVRAIYNGTSKYLTVKARTAESALAKVRRSRQVKGASCFIVMLPKTGNNAAMPIHVARA